MTSSTDHQTSVTPQIDRIADATAAALGRHGFYGMTIQEVADAVGLTKPGLLHYVGNKLGLMTLALDYYDASEQGSRQVFRGILNADEDDTAGYCLPELFRRNIAVNMQRPEMVRMFAILNGESISPDAPFHDYFVNRDSNIVDECMRYRWHVPAGTRVRDVIVTAFNTMDGLQTRWLRDQDTSLEAMWSVAEDSLFPLPQWEGFR